MLLTKARSNGANKLNIAIIGAGISGLGAAYPLAPHHKVTVFEARPRLGGHTRTLTAGRDEQFPVDTGFMVFNDLNYPNLNALFTELKVPFIRSNMSFAVSLDGGKFEYGLHQLARVFAQKRNLASPRFYKMIADILKFNKQGLAYKNRPDVTLGQALTEMGMSDWFIYRYLCPLAGAIWSTTSGDMLNFPAQSLIRFFDNHRLMSVSDNPAWHTVQGGSKVYLQRLETALISMNCTVRTGAPVTAVSRDVDTVRVKSDKHGSEDFDHVIFACHSDQALKIIDDPSRPETDVLGAIRYKNNAVILHDDPSQMPKRKACWSSWVYQGEIGNRDENSFTYWMNLLQSIPETSPVFVTLNPKTPIKDEFIYNEAVLAHPQFDLPALRAQEQIPSLQGVNNTWFCGAYTKHGFHEDGLTSGLDVAEAIMGAHVQTRITGSNS